MADLQHALPDLREAGISVVAVSNDTPTKAEQVRVDQALEYPLVSDDGLRIARAYGVRQRGVEAALPAAFVLDESGRVVFVHVSTDPAVRPDPVELLAALAR